MSVLVEIWATDGGYKSKLGLYVRDTRDGHTSGTIVAPHPLSAKAELARWSALVINHRTRQIGSNPWVNGRTGMVTWVTDDDPNARKRKDVSHGLCWQLVSTHGVSLAPCGRVLVEQDPDGLCKMHRAAQRRSDESMARHRAEWAARRENERRDAMLSDDLDQLWRDVCDMREIEPARFGRARIVDGVARVDAEVLSTLLRELRDR